MRSSLALLIMTAIVAAATTVTLKVTDHGVELVKVQIHSNNVAIEQYQRGVVEAKSVLTDKLSEAQGLVTENITSNVVATLSSSPIKRGHAVATLLMLSNPKKLDISVRLKGSLLVLLFYIRDADILIRSEINKTSGVGTLNLKGFVSLPAPKITVERFLNNMVPRIKDEIKKLGLEILELKYEVRGKKLPPTSEINFEVKLRGSKENVLKALNSLGISLSDVLSVVNLNDTVTRKISGNLTLDASLERKGINFYTIAKAKIAANGVYPNDTIKYEVEARLEPILKALNVTELKKFLEVKSPVTSAVTAEVKKGEVIITSTFKNVYFKNTKEFWNTLLKLENSGNVTFKVICKGETLPLKKAMAECGG